MCSILQKMCDFTGYICKFFFWGGGTADGGTVFKVVCYKSEDRWFDSRLCHCNFLLT
jgi:hypothetical protein